MVVSSVGPTDMMSAHYYNTGREEGLIQLRGGPQLDTGEMERVVSVRPESVTCNILRISQPQYTVRGIETPVTNSHGY